MRMIFMTNFHDNKDWNKKHKYRLLPGYRFMTNFHDNKDWNMPLFRISKGMIVALWPTSMTTRIETITNKAHHRCGRNFMTNFHDNKDWNKKPKTAKVISRIFMTNFHDNKDWNLMAFVVSIRQANLYDQLPWQQGLKLSLREQWIEIRNLYDQLPWQQGLKRYPYPTARSFSLSLWPTSMTTRIETE